MQDNGITALPPFCLWEEYQRTGEYRDMMRWLKQRAYCYATEPEWDNE